MLYELHYNLKREPGSEPVIARINSDLKCRSNLSFNDSDIKPI